jgi:hypothetical protein
MKHEQTTFKGMLSRSMPKEAKENKMDFESTPLFQASLEAERAKAQPSLFNVCGACGNTENRVCDECQECDRCDE